MDLSDADLDTLQRKLRFKVRHHVGFTCPDVDDIVQETLTRFLRTREGAVGDPARIGAFLNGICQNVIQEYRRRWHRDMPVSDTAPELQDNRLAHSEVLELQDAIASGMQQLSSRDRHVLKCLYLDEWTKDEILAGTGLTEENFRVVLFRAKEKFRQIYGGNLKRRAVSSHK